MKLYFIRHGKTQWNLEGRFQGSNGDSPLLDESIHEIKILGNRLKEIPFDAIYSSDLKRAKDTAQLLAEAADLSLPITYSSGFCCKVF